MTIKQTFFTIKIVHDSQYDKNYQLYISHKLNKEIQQNIQFIQNSPNVLILSQQPHHLIIEQEYDVTLKQYLSIHQKQTGQPYLQQNQARIIILDLIKSLQSYTRNHLDYDCINEYNIIRKNGKWMLSLAGLLTGHGRLNSNYYDKQNKNKQIITYSLANLFFKLIFGFVPFEENIKKPNEFNFNRYIEYLQKYQKNNKMLKVYSFVQHVDTVSIKLKSLLTDCLSTNKIKTLEEFLSNEYFYELPLTYQSQKIKSCNSLIQSSNSPMKQTNLIKNKQIKMISLFDNKYLSLIMASIEYKKKNPFSQLNTKPQTDRLNFIQLQQSFKIDPLLSFLHFAPTSNQNQQNAQNQNLKKIYMNYQYFNRNFQYDQGERPTLELIKLIEKDKLKSPQLYQKDADRQSKIKLYAYPYTIVFELANVYAQQKIDINKKIQSLIPFLLSISNLNWPIAEFEPLHPINKQKIKFQDIKYKYRELINLLYKHFLMEAMKKYNAKKQNLAINEKIKLKEQGIEYYRLCLKLMQASVIIRKQGKDLDLQRIETSQRKQIQNDLETLLKTYFPNKVQIK